MNLRSLDRKNPSQRGDEDDLKFLTLLIYKGKHLFWLDAPPPEPILCTVDQSDCMGNYGK